MDIIEKLLCGDEWARFAEYKIGGGHMSKAEEKELTEFVDEKQYLPVAERLSAGGFFSVPKAAKINKSHTDKKRTVFTFERNENYILKFISYCLLDYDGIFADNLYSFRRDMGVKKAVTRLVYHKGINKMYSFKVDISDYFNSVNPDILLPELKAALPDEKRLCAVLENMLTNPYAVLDGETVEIRKGVLAGSPVAGFLANLYLAELDRYFDSRGVLYARYSDDIIIFADSEEELEKHRDYLLGYVKSRGLEVNDSKVFYSAPHEKWTFLGFSYENGTIDISDISKMKLKKKMRRKARALVRWKRRKNATGERAARAFIKHFDKKLYANDAKNEITWSRWYFPVITTANGLKEIDEYAQQCLRYIVTEKQNKSKYAFTYDEMKALGYTTLVNNYYKYKKEK